MPSLTQLAEKMERHCLEFRQESSGRQREESMVQRNKKQDKTMRQKDETAYLD